MKIPPNGNSARRWLLNQTPDAAPTTAAHNPPDPPDEGRSGKGTAAPLIGRALRFRASPPAKYALDIVICELCRLPHRHRSFDGRTRYERALPCRPSRTYWIQVDMVVPEVVEPAQRRQREAAAA